MFSKDQDQSIKLAITDLGFYMIILALIYILGCTINWDCTQHTDLY